MGRLLDLTFYNPAKLEDEDFVKGFVARRVLVEKILARLGEITPDGLAGHRLILGQRGMGKTSLLRRIALGVRDTPALASTLLPLTFREEQYNVHNMHVFWCNCLDSLGDWFEASGQGEKADRVDREVAVLDSRDDDDEGSAALSVFRGWAKIEGKRPLLLLDNIDLVLGGLKDKQWSLRRILQERRGIVVIGATAAFLETTIDPEAAFYEFFQVDVLEKLSREELFSCLRQLAAERGEAGQKVTEVLNRDPARVRVLYDLTGGNPRTLAMLYLMLEMLDDGDLMRDLERLLDQATPLYKARVEELSPQARVVFDAVALNWDPIIAANVAGSTGLPVGTVSAQINRMERDGLVEKKTLSSSARAGFQVAERFFNIWYLMRHAPRRQRNRLRWLTRFLRSFYTPSQLVVAARDLMRRSGSDRLTAGMYCLALSDAMEDRDTQRALRFEAKQHLERHAVESGNPRGTLWDAKEIQNPVSARDWILHGNFLVSKIEAFERAEAAYRKAIELDPKSAFSWNSLGNLLSDYLNRHEEAGAAYRKAIELDPKVAWPWNNLGILYAKYLNRYEEAEAAYRKAIELGPKVAWPWNGLGELLAEQLGRPEEAEQAYRRAEELDPAYICPIRNLAYLLLGQENRREEAEDHYKRTVEALPAHGADLLEAYRALAHDNFGDATDAFEAVLEQGHAELFSVFYDDLLRVLWLAADRGYGDKLISWLDESGLKDRYWPLWAAFNAYLFGEDRLQDVNPEVRSAAQRILERLAGRPKATPS